MFLAENRLIFFWKHIRSVCCFSMTALFADNVNFASDNTHKKIWAKVMNEIIKTKQEQTTDFKKPADIVKAKVCKESGKLAIKEVCDHDPRGSRVITEYFEKGTVPTQTCDIHVAVEVCKTSDKLATKNCPANKK